MENINVQLNYYQEIWFKNIFEPYVSENADKNISYPFFTGVSEKYLCAKKRLMIVGQETNGWSVYKPDWTIADSQKWAINYLDYQLHYSNDPNLKLQFGKRNSSPFWSFFKPFSNDEIVPCWNNIDKAQRCINGKTKSLTVDVEMELNKKLPNTDKTLFQNEVEITKPDIIVFITGPYYHATMERAMNIEKGVLQSLNLSYETGCIDITSVSGLEIPTFWTYHPRHISSRKNPLCRDDIIKIIKGRFD